MQKRKRTRSVSNVDHKKQRLESRGRSLSKPARDEMGVKDVVVNIFWIIAKFFLIINYY